MRLIDADVLKRRAQKVATEAWKMKLNAKIETTLNQFIDWIDHAKTIEPENRWTPVSERLPEKCGVYLVSGSKRVWLCEWVQMMTVYGWANDARNPVVVAWMPLPEPYGGEQE